MFYLDAIKCLRGCAALYPRTELHRTAVAESAEAKSVEIMTSFPVLHQIGHDTPGGGTNAKAMPTESGSYPETLEW